MKTFILENIYMSDMSAPSVCSTNRFPTFESAMEEAHKQFKEEAKTYRKSYGADNITTEECYRDLYIKGPDFIAPSVLWCHPQNGCLLSLRAIAGDDQIAQWDTRYGETAGKSNVNCEER